MKSKYHDTPGQKQLKKDEIETLRRDLGEVIQHTQKRMSKDPKFRDLKRSISG